jgi:hypothetical protein
MKTITISSHAPDGTDQRKKYQYLLLDQVFRDAASDRIAWEFTPRDNPGEGFLAEYRNKDTGVVIRCESSGNGHTFALTEPVDIVPGRSSVQVKESEAL